MLFGFGEEGAQGNAPGKKESVLARKVNIEMNGRALARLS